MINLVVKLYKNENIRYWKRIISIMEKKKLDIIIL